MYKDQSFSPRILIIKTSSLGDIIQAFNVLDDLHDRFESPKIDWVVEKKLHQVVSSHPLIDRVIPLNMKEKKGLLKDLKYLRKTHYDLVFDLQANIKSGLITLLSKGTQKIGYGFRSVREWPNVFSTNLRFNIDKNQNIRFFYLELIQKYFQSTSMIENQGVRFKISQEEKQKIKALLSYTSIKIKIMVCPGSKWVNKQLKVETLIEFLKKIELQIEASFFLIWGSEDEKQLCNRIQKELKEAVVVDRLPLPSWQYLMNEVSCVIAVDSSALHLCGTTPTPSFSIFGPTKLNIFQPIGKKHGGIQGKCPYGQSFLKQCPILRSCSTGACIKNLSAEEIFQSFLHQCSFLKY